MNKRNYNVFFNMHTVSGIVISIGLYVIFFAGAFTLFQEEIAIWETGAPISHQEKVQIDFDKIIKEVSESHDLLGRDIRFNFESEGDEMYVYLAKTKDTVTNKNGATSNYFYINTKDYEQSEYLEHYTLAQFLYRLHFFSQIPYIGNYLSGFIALFFLFAIVTGAIVHWKKMVSNFFAFSPKALLKRVWTDAHTALGIIGLPYQFIFAVTGAYFCLSLLVLLPANILYGGDRNALFNDFRPDRAVVPWESVSDKTVLSFNDFAQSTCKRWDGFQLQRGGIKNFGGTNMQYLLTGKLTDPTKFSSTGWLIQDAHSGALTIGADPFDTPYSDSVQNVMRNLHFASFGGYLVKVVYFILALITCFVIITGVLIWIEARNKKTMTLKQRKYTVKIGHIYLASCLSLFPVTALAFVFVKLTHGMFVYQKEVIYTFYFCLWLLMTLFFRFKRDNYFTNKYTLLMGAIFSFIIPVANGTISNNWLWNSYAQGQTEVFIIDIIWLMLGMTSLGIYFKIHPKVKQKSTFYTNPIAPKRSSKIV